MRTCFHFVIERVCVCVPVLTWFGLDLLEIQTNLDLNNRQPVICYKFGCLQMDWFNSANPQTCAQLSVIIMYFVQGIRYPLCSAC